MTDKKGKKGKSRVQNVMGDQFNIKNANMHGDVFYGGSHTINKVQNTGLSGSEVSVLFDKLYEQIKSRPDDPNIDKAEIASKVKEIQEEASKGGQANETKLERWMKNLNEMAPDIVDVALASLGGPVSGVTAVLKKIADRAKQQPAA